MKATMFLMALAAASMPAWAADPPSGQEDALQVLLKQQQDLKADVEDGGIEGLTPRQNKIVRKSQDEVFAVTQGKTTIDQLSVDEKIRLENALERINAEIVNTRAASDDQNICWRERVSGTSMKKTRCGTQAEMREAREGARDYLEEPKICVPPGCGGN